MGGGERELAEGDMGGEILGDRKAKQQKNRLKTLEGKNTCKSAGKTGEGSNFGCWKGLSFS